MKRNGLSIIVTYYKGKKFIYNCLNSIIQSYYLSKKEIDLQILVVIDSMDDADSIEEELKAKYGDHFLLILNNPKNLGVSASRNEGLKYIKYNFCTIIDQDDYVKPEYFKVLEAQLMTNIPITIINGNIKYIEKGIESKMYTLDPVFKFEHLILKDTFIYTPGLVIFNVALVNVENLFIDTSDKYKGCDDWAAYLNLLLNYNDKISYKYISASLFVYCIHSSNYSNNKEEMIRSSKAVLEFLSNHQKLNSNNLKVLNKARKMQDFYLKKDLGNTSTLSLIGHFPKEFLYNYCFGFVKVDNLNKVFLKVNYVIQNLIKNIVGN